MQLHAQHKVTLLVVTLQYNTDTSWSLINTNLQSVCTALASLETFKSGLKIVRVCCSPWQSL